MLQRDCKWIANISSLQSASFSSFKDPIWSPLCGINAALLLPHLCDRWWLASEFTPKAHTHTRLLSTLPCSLFDPPPANIPHHRRSHGDSFVLSRRAVCVHECCHHETAPVKIRMQQWALSPPLCSGNVPLTALYIKNQMHACLRLFLVHKCMNVQVHASSCLRGKNDWQWQKKSLFQVD